MKSQVVSNVSRSQRLVATLITRPGRNEIVISSLNDKDLSLNNKIEFHSGENVLDMIWLPVNNEVGSSKKRGGSDRSKSKSKDLTFNEYFAILLDSGIILIYSPLTKDYINKITNDVPLLTFTSNEDNKSYDIITFEQNFGLKFYSSVNPQLINSILLKDVSDVRFIYSFNGKYKLILSNDVNLYFLNEANEIDLVLPLPSNCNCIKKIIDLQNGNLLLIDGSNLFYMLNLSNMELATTFKTFKSNDNIVNANLINDALVSIVNANGNIEIFNLDSDTPLTTLVIQGGEKVGKFIYLLSINEQLFKGIWFDSFNINITDFEFDDISQLQGEIPITVMEITDDRPSETDLTNSEINNPEEGDEDDETHKSNHTNIDIREEHKCETPESLQKLLAPFLQEKLSTNTNMSEDEFISILVQNSSTNEIKQLIYLLQKDNILILFANICQVLSSFIGLGSPQNDNSIKLNLKNWFQWTLFLNGNIIINDVNCVEWLKLVQSGLNQDVKLLPQMLKLQGKLELLKDQLQLRKNMSTSSSQSNTTPQTVSELLDGTIATEDSVVFEGEDAFDEDEDDDEDEDEDDDDNDDDDDDAEQ